ncbi:MAG: LytTR family transcriptional regulator DNA-binding domain-containing protein [Bacteroidaceae bacterium]|nr:LytTR family transcriptional regulator DNA-binding domain-containing protein [Bacteroidaceae bacterium]
MAQAGLLNDIWQTVLQILPYLLLLLLHHFVLAPLFFKKKYLIYIPLTLALLTAFGFYCFKVDGPADSPGRRPEQFQQRPGQFQGPPMPRPQEGMAPPADGMNPPMGDMRPPMEGMRPQMMPNDHHRPLRPETMKLLIALLLICVDLGAMAYIRNLHTEKQVQHLKAENEENQSRLQQLSHSAENAHKADSELFFKTDYKQVRIKPDKILYIEGMGEYLKIYHLDAATPLVVLMSMKRILEQLPDDRFARVHKSYIVNLNRIINSSRTQVTMENATVIPIGESYRAAISDRLKHKEHKGV